MVNEIAIVGMSCRLPGAADLGEYWRLLANGRDAIGSAPADRPGIDERGGFLESVSEYDADFFGVPPKEAHAIDPQQLLGLELSWEAWEDAGQRGSNGDRAGVFLGSTGTDFAEIVASQGIPGVGRHSLWAVGRGVAANRISNFYGFTGPSLVVDSGQSSSLVAVHLACESIRNGECDVALAGGINLILSPLSGERIEHFGAASELGKCHAFDDRADGIVRGEGGGVVVLKSLTQAVADGDRIYAVIRGSSVNNGNERRVLSAPSAASQATVIRAALAAADVAGASVQYVELHGTGTPAGDPVEAAALADTYGADRPDDAPLAVGSVKTNIGHLEGAAGIAGLIKTALSLHHRMLAPSLNFRTPNPRIPLDVLKLRVVTDTQEWPDADIRRAGVSAFGMGGTNAHVVLEQAPAVEPAAADDPADELLTWTLSARSPAALRGQAARLRAWLDENPDVDVAGVSHSLTRYRATLDWRGAVVGHDLNDLKAGLTDLGSSESAEPLVVSGRAMPRRTVAFVFPGQGSQWAGMAAGLLADGGATGDGSARVFAESIAECEAALAPFIDWSLTAVLRDEPGAPSLERVDVVQPVLWAVNVSLARLWRANGVEPSVVIGHSQGEVAAAVVVGALTLSDGARVIALRSIAGVQELVDKGAMAAVGLSAAAVTERLVPYGDQLSLAAVNGPTQTVVSGTYAALEEFVAACAADGIWARTVPATWPGHSPVVEQIRDRLLTELAPIRPRESTIPMFSTVVADYVDTSSLNADYWYRSLREPVRFAESIETLMRSGVDAFVEISAHSVVAMAIDLTAESIGMADRVAAIGTLKRKFGRPDDFRAALARAYCIGIDSAQPTPTGTLARVDLPSYAFQRQRYWSPDSVVAAGAGDVSSAGLVHPDHPILGAAVSVAGRDEWLFTGRLTGRTHPWLVDHVAGGAAIVPAAVWIEAAVAVGARVGAGAVAQLRVTQAVIPTTDALNIQVNVAAPDEDARRAVTIHTRADDGEWMSCATGVLVPSSHDTPAWSGGDWPPAAAEALAVDELYDRLAARGFDYGVAFQGVIEAWRRGAEVFTSLSLDDRVAERASTFGIHPALLDAALHAATAEYRDDTSMPLEFTGIRLHHAGAAAARSRVERIGADALRVTVVAENGDPILTVASVTMVPVELTVPVIPVAEVAPARKRRAVVAGPLAPRLFAAPEHERDALVLSVITDQAAAVLGHESADVVEPDLPFTAFGFDSLSGQTLRARLVAATGLELPSTLVFDYPTPLAVARLVRARLEGVDLSAKRTTRRTRSDEPIAIVGIGCRFPGGVASAEDLWDLVAGGVDAITPFPTDRGWDLDRLFDPDPAKPGTVYTREGGFLTNAGDFDAAFFGIGPREAAAMDPQQRLMLEVSWEALENAGIDPATLRGGDAGVYVGACSSGYSRGVTGEHEAYRLTGTSHSVISGRVAYVLGLEGPAVTVDTACSSSLVALHLACQALRQGETSLVLTGGVSVSASPGLYVDFARQRGLSPDGRSKAFAATADGVTWSEGVGVLVLERLSDAQRLGHNVLAVVRGSAINQDGASNGLTAPNGPSQERVITAALANAGLEPSDVDAVEAHGTGTALGDPIEAQAIIATYGHERDQPLRIGSIKSNIGHAVAAAGVGGVIKMIAALHYETLPKTLHVDELTPHVDWSAGTVQVLTEPHPWAAGDRVRRAGVSSFGISGTNAHVILEEPPVPVGGRSPGPPGRVGLETPALGAGAGNVGVSPPARLVGPGDRPPAGAGLPVLPVPLVVSGKTEGALRGQAGRLREWLGARPEADLASVAQGLIAGRGLFEQRAVVLAGNRDQALAGLAAVAADEVASSVVTGQVMPGKTAFLFTGQGAQRPGMGAGLYEAFPVFAAAVDEICAEFDPLLGQSLRALMFGTDAEILARTDITQPALFAFEVAMYRLLASFGIAPDTLIGHSIGELAAAHVAGVWSLADACALVAARGRLMGALPEGGAMLAVAVGEHRAVELATEFEVSVAAINDPSSTVLSGASDNIELLERLLADEGVKTNRLRVSHAFHSELMDPMLDEFRSVAEGIEYHEPVIPVIGADVTDPEYWVRQVRGCVRYAPGVETLGAQGVRRFVEVGPDAVLAALTRRGLAEDLEASSAIVPTARRSVDEATQFRNALAQVHVAGVRVDWSPLVAGAQHAERPIGTGADRITLPTYAFQHRRFWLEPKAFGDAAASDTHPILTGVLPLAGSDEWLFTGQLSLRAHPWVADHMTYGVVVVPSATLVEFLMVAGGRIGCGVVEELTLQAPILPTDKDDVELQVSVGSADESGRRAFEFYFRLTADEEWTHNATGALASEWRGNADLLARLQDEQWPPVDAEVIDPAWVPAQIAKGSGLEYGPAFLGVHGAWHRDGTVFSEIALDTAAAPEFARHHLHPALLDLVMHSGLAQLAWAEMDTAGAEGRLLFSWGGARFHQPVPDEVTSLRVIAVATGAETVSVATVDPDGNPVVSVDAVVMRAYNVQEFRRTIARDDSALYQVKWETLAVDAVTGPARTHDRFDVHSTGSSADDVRSTLYLALSTVQTWLTDPDATGKPLVVVTANGAGLPGESPDLAAAGVWGLVRSAQSEYPDRVVLLDHDPASPVTPDQLAAVLSSGESQVAVRGNDLLVPRLVGAAVESSRLAAAPAFGDGTVLITGGTGGLGALFARHLVATHGVRSLLLTSRRGPDAPGAAELVAELAAAGAHATVVACDVAVRDEVQNLLRDNTITSVVHTAGVLDDGTIAALTGDQFDRVLAPKLDGATHLDELTRDHDLSAFVLFSSIAGVLGTSGQGNYAAANAVLDAVAQRRRAQGLPATSLAWGPWNQGSGMTGGLDRATFARLGRLGLGQLENAEGIRLFDAAIAHPESRLALIRFDASELRREADPDEVPAVLRGFVRPTRPSPPSAASVPAAGALATRLAEVPEARRREVVLDVVAAHAAAVLGYDSGDDIRADQRFDEIGFDSLGGVEFRNRLAKATGVPLPATLVFDHPTVAAVATLLQTKVTPSDTVATPVKRVARKSRSDDPIAIVGMSCRFPGGVNSPEDLWELLASGSDAIGEFPTDRGWDLDRLIDPNPDKPGTVYTSNGGFLYDAGDFDAGFFGISPREASAMDPQQRLLLEASWEALEDAGIDPVSLRGSDTGVFAGACYSGYFDRVNGELEGYRLTGTTHSVISGRVSYVFGLEGPAVTVDTACSSSLVSLHQACQALRNGETSLALSSGVTVAANPYLYVDFARQRGLSPDGRCKSFSSSADGVAFSEGVGVLVLERLSDAKRLGHTVLALVRGTAVNQDGASNGLTAPNGPSQERVIAAALADAGLEPSDIDAVEAHGTGTKLGDPIEAQAIIATYGQGRVSGHEPVRIGSIKSNIGHTVAAAGVGGVIKMVQAMRHETLPKTLHVDEPSPHVEWAAGDVALLTESTPWPAGPRIRRAGVSSFGVSGTNAHAILEEAPAGVSPSGIAVGSSRLAAAGEGARPPAGSALVLVLSGSSEAGLRGQAERLRVCLTQEPAVDLSGVAQALATTRAQLERRGAVVGRDRDELMAGLAALASGEPGTIEANVGSGKSAFLFTGQGAQRPGMGAGLYARFPVFATALDEICAQIDPLLGQSLRDLMFGDGVDAAELARTEFTQPALFAFEVALFRLVVSFGVRPDMLVGHSIGELAAAHVAGVWSLADAAALVVARGRLMGALPAGGAMLAVAMSEEDATELLGSGVSLAAVNGPLAVVLSGDADSIDEIAARCAADGVKTSRLQVSHAFHSHLMEPMLDEFRSVAAGLTYRDPEIPVGGAEVTDPEYWVQQVRGCVRFASNIASVAKSGVRRYLEIGPDAVLTAMTRQCLAEKPDIEARSTVIAAARRTNDEDVQLTSALAQAAVVGVAVDWSPLFTGAQLAERPMGSAAQPAERIKLPTYAFQHQRYWLPTAAAPDVWQSGLADAGHPLLGAMVQLPDSSDLVFTGRISQATHPWLADHAVAGVVLLPGAALVDLALHVGTLMDQPQLAELVIEAPLLVPAAGAVELRVVANGSEVSVHSRTDDASWVRHAVATLSAETPAAAPHAMTTWPPPGVTPLPVEGAYPDLAERGYDYGPAFQGVTALWRGDDAVYAEVALPAAVSADGFGVHPALLDAALHAILLGGLTPDTGPGDIAVPFLWENVALFASGATALRVRAVTDGDRVAISAADSTGMPVAEVGALTLRPIATAGRGAAERPNTDDLGYTVDWLPLPVTTEKLPRPKAWTNTDGGEHITVAGEAAVVITFDPTFDDDLATTVRVSVTTLMTELQRLLTQDRLIVVVTRHAVATDAAEPIDLMSAAAWGLLRTAHSENPDRIRIVDVDTWSHYRDAVILALSTPTEPQQAVRSGMAYVPRVGRGVREWVPVIYHRYPLTYGTWALTPGDTGTLTADNFTVAEVTRGELQAGHVRVAVRAVGINFRDVLVTLGTYPDPEATIGGEGAGVVVEVADDVTEFAPGDRVFGFVSGVGSESVVDRRLLAPMPREWTFAQAAAVPVVYATAYYSLVDLAGAKPGERLLLHAATGGVGLAAIQVARHLGLRLLVTASEPKWSVLRERGFADEQIGDSRTIDFESKFLDATGGRGVDIVLDSLAGEFVDASLRLLPRGGRFVEMGMIDRRDPDEVAAAHPGVQYQSFMLMDTDPDRLHEILTALVELFDAGTLTTSATTAWDVRRTPEAFRYLSQARHIGKNVLTVPVPLNPAGTVLITGGTGGLAPTLARHLITQHGVRRLLLTSRRGPAAPGAAELQSELTALGAHVDVVACDAADRSALDAMLASIPAEHPLTGVVHAAGVLADGLLATMSRVQVATVLRPKAEAAWNLHEATKNLDLSMFVLYSSIAGVIGSPGQANYAAANVFLDALAHHRQLRGLPATSVAWGPWSGGGMASSFDAARWRREGLLAIDDDAGMALFDAALAAGRAGFVAAPLDRVALAHAGPDELRSIMRGLTRPTRRRAAEGGGTGAVDLATNLTGRPVAEQERLILDVIAAQIGAVLGHSPDSIAPDKPFTDIGFDSLGVMEFRNRMKSAAGVPLPATAMFDHPTPAALATLIRQEIVPADDPAARVATDVDALARTVADIELSVADRNDLAAKLTAMLRQLGANTETHHLDAADDSELFDFIDNL